MPVLESPNSIILQAMYVKTTGLLAITMWYHSNYPQAQEAVTAYSLGESNILLIELPEPSPFQEVKKNHKKIQT